MKFLLDTNVISELRKGPRAKPRVLEWYDSTSADEKFLSVLSLGEIRCGIERVRGRDPRQARAIEAWLRGLLTDYADRVLAIDAPVAEEWGRLNVPSSLPVVDGLLAATAKVHGLTLASRNVKDVARTGVPVVNPFEP